MNIDEFEINLGSGLRAVLQEFGGTPVTAVTRPELGVDLALPELGESFEAIRKLANDMRWLPVDSLPAAIANVAMGHFDNVRAQIKNIHTFGLANYQNFGNQPTQARQRLLNEFEKAAREFFVGIAPIYAYAAAQRESPSETQLMEASARANTELAAIKRRGEEMEGILSAARETAGKVGVATHAKLFETEAEKHETASRWWLLAAGLLGVLTLAAAIISALSVSNRTTPLTAAQSAQIIVAKVILFSILGSAAIWCAKMYRAHRHNAVVNRHRQNALSTFETFAAATDDPQTKNAVLIQATTSIFAPQSSGYGGDTDPHSPAQLIELIRSVPGPK